MATKNLVGINQITNNTYNSSTLNNNTLYFVRNSDSSSSAYGDSYINIGNKSYGQYVKLPKSGYKFLSANTVSTLTEALVSLNNSIDHVTLSGNYLPLSGGDVSGSTYFSKDTAGMVDGSASLYVPNGHFFVGSSATTNYCTISSERQCTRDNNRINATQYFTNADGRSKFSHKGNGVKNGKDDAYMCFNQDGFKVAYSHSF